MQCTKWLINHKVRQLPSSICQKRQKMLTPCTPLNGGKAVMCGHRPQLAQHDTVEVARIAAVAKGMCQQAASYVLTCLAMA